MASDPLQLELHTNSCELAWGHWELNLGPVEEQSVFSTTEPSFYVSERSIF